MRRPVPPVNNILFALAWLIAGTFSAVAASTHTVSAGESLDSIGRQYGVTASAIAAENGLARPELIQPGQTLKIPAGPGAPRVYQVKPGDTLGEIAANHGITAEAIATLNAIDDPKKIKAGQTLKLPAATSAAAGASASATREHHPLPADLKRILDATPVKSGHWRYIVIHHSGTPNGSLKGMDMYHRQKRKMENGLAYHFVIGNGNGMPDGKIDIGNRWKRQIKGGHLSSDKQNAVALGICLVGNFEAQKPTAAQMKSLYALTSYLMRRTGIPRARVQTHREINVKPTACPGKHFPEQLLLKNL